MVIYNHNNDMANDRETTEIHITTTNVTINALAFQYLSNSQVASRRGFRVLVVGGWEGVRPPPNLGLISLV